MVMAVTWSHLELRLGCCRGPAQLVQACLTAQYPHQSTHGCRSTGTGLKERAPPPRERSPV
ncbi:hypothetical protein T484DRAFT_1953930 [Baffinella frigidus]|nr:hypothetical protein T484DRAFT_1953930 [Cryptophyta sp. CCMP2293]